MALSLSLWSAYRQRKKTKKFIKNIREFLRYNSDIIEQKEYQNLTKSLAELKTALQNKNTANMVKLIDFLSAKTKIALPYKYQTHNTFADSLESFFIIIVVIFTIRSYFIQPFKIPTGSMQPSLNGIIGKPLANKDWPTLNNRIKDYIIAGKSYLHVTLPTAKTLVSIEENTVAFIIYTKLTFADGNSRYIFTSKSVLINDLKLGARLSPYLAKFYSNNYHDTMSTGGYKAFIYQFLAKNKVTGLAIELPKGFVLAEGVVQSGDLILVNKMIYHFRRPINSEVFVFNTINLPIGGGGGNALIQNQTNAKNYIKRLVGSPGETLELVPSQGSPQDKKISALLYRDGKKAQEATIARVESGANNYTGYRATQLLANGKKVTLKNQQSGAKKGYNEYFAMGDNSPSSYDSRHWGPVKEFNLEGRAFFVVWPFANNAGIID